jgi:hypothetical protein
MLTKLTTDLICYGERKFAQTLLYNDNVGEINCFSLRRQNAEEAFFLLNAANPLRINPMKNQSENLFI